VHVALDTNILAYAEGVIGEHRRQRALSVLTGLAADDLVVPAQTLAELFTLSTRNARWPVAKARAAVLTWHDTCLVVDTTSAVLLEAMDLAVMHQYALWDAIILAASAQAGCRLLLSEDMQDGFIWRGSRFRIRLWAATKNDLERVLILRRYHTRSSRAASSGAGRRVLRYYISDKSSNSVPIVLRNDSPPMCPCARSRI
jgi:predicted nucleic acid-binding protein